MTKKQCPFGKLNKLTDTLNTIRTVRKFFEEDPDGRWLQGDWIRFKTKNDDDFDGSDFNSAQDLFNYRKKNSKLPPVEGVCLEGALALLGTEDGFQDAADAILEANSNFEGYTIPDINDSELEDGDHAIRVLVNTERDLKAKIIVAAAQL